MARRVRDAQQELGHGDLLIGLAFERVEPSSFNLPELVRHHTDSCIENAAITTSSVDPTLT